ncbi:MAG: hypothetical protein LBJ67_11570 [Planctomycetaceae bacterium]|jgi:hypothetical protein|nr:hypothetical protein [Planctomycetaceae bacterium]
MKMNCSLRLWTATALLSLSAIAVSATTVSAADAVALPPAADLEFQVDYYVKELAKDLEDLSSSKDFAADSSVLSREGNALVLVSLAIGLSEEESKYKAAAPSIIKAAKDVAAAKDLAGAKAAVEALNKSLAAKSDEKLEWKKVAEMSPTMKLAVPRINTSMTRYVRIERALKTGIDNVKGGTAAFVAISQGLEPNFDETKKPDQKDKWLELSHDFRDAALKANTAAHGFEKGNVQFADFKKAVSEMKESCEKCHAVFAEDSVAVE